MPNGTLFLAIETSSLRGAVALFRGRDCLREVLFPEGLVHGREIAFRIRELLESEGLGRRDLEAIAVSRGPGSYTGTRVGVTCGKTLAWALALPLVEVSSLEVLARTALELDVPGPRAAPQSGAPPGETSSSVPELVPVLDARRGFFYAARFAAAGDPREGVVRRSSDRLVRLEELRRLLDAPGVGALLCGDGADVVLESLARDGSPELIRRAPRDADLPRAAALGRIAASALEGASFDRESLHRLEPAYLRPSEPEILLDRSSAAGKTPGIRAPRTANERRS